MTARNRIGSLRRRRQLRERARDLEQPGRPGRVVFRAVVDRVAVHRRADAEVVPVRGVDHVLVLQRRIAAFELASTFFESIGAQLVVRSSSTRARPSGTGLKSRVAACALSASKSWPAIFSSGAALIERDPALDRRAAHVLVRRDEVELLAGLALDDVERDSRPVRSRE